MTLRTIFTLALLVPASLAFAQDDTLSTDTDRMSYSLGVQFGQFMVEGKELVDMEVVLRAIDDIFEGRDPAMNEEEARAAFEQFQQTVRTQQGAAAKTEGEAFLLANAKKEGVITLPSGLQYKVITKGTGPKPEPTDTVETHYRGTFIDGQEFDSSYSRNAPSQFPVNRVIAGWTEALQLMSVGSKWELAIPYALAYGESGNQSIPPFSALVFEIELLSIVETP